MLLVGALINFGIGYALYVVALAQSTPPAWAIDYIEQLKPTVKALDVAVRLSDRPFPAQVLILYAMVMTALQATYYIFCTFFVKRMRLELEQRVYERVQKWGDAVFSAATTYRESRAHTGVPPQEVRVTPKMRLKFAGMGVVMVLAALSFPVVLVAQDPTDISWRAQGFFSPSFLSVTVLLIVSNAVALACMLGPWFIYTAVGSYIAIESKAPIRR